MSDRIEDYSLHTDYVRRCVKRLVPFLPFYAFFFYLHNRQLNGQFSTVNVFYSVVVKQTPFIHC